MPKSTKRPQRASKRSLLEQQVDELQALLPSKQDWRTSDEQELARRRIRALQNPPAIRNLRPREKIHSTFEVISPESNRAYEVEIIDLSARLFHSTSPDFATSGLGTCKHTEAVLFHLQKRFPRLYQRASRHGPLHATLIVRSGDLFVHCPPDATIPRRLRLCIDGEGIRKKSCPPEKLLKAAETSNTEGVRISRQVGQWLEEQRRLQERHELRHQYELKVHAGEFPQHETLLPLFPYQREGMLHLAFTERAMVADEMGLGKTIQGIAAAALLRRLGKAERCLIVVPTSLKAEWEEQIAKFTTLPCEIVYGNRSQRVHAYQNPSAFFIIVNYEQVRSDSLDINAALHPDIVILDEAQRIKNWASLTARAIKRLESRYAFVLTGTPIENRIDELYSIVEFLDPALFGALFRFNREYYALDEKGKPEGYRNLDRLREKVAPILLRRRKADVETELPDRSDENRFVELTEGQKSDYGAQQESVRKLIHLARKRPLRREEHQRLMMHLGMMRMVCDTQYILDGETRVSPKLDELADIFDEALLEPGTKIIVFSEWVRMLELIRDHLRDQKIGFAWHTGKVPQKKRRVEIRAFKEDPACRVFLCTESGGAGLNLQNASLVINVDLPWNPAKLEQRIARAWRKGQTRPVQVINLIAEGTIEHGMLETLAMKQGLADGVLDGKGELSEIKLKRGGQSFLTRLEQTLEIGKQQARPKERQPAAPADPARALVNTLPASHRKNLLLGEEHFIDEGGISKLYLVVDHLTPALEKAVRAACAGCYPDQHDLPNWFEENIVLVDAATHQSLLQLQRSGFMQTRTRARRNLLDRDASADSAPSLTPEQQARIEELERQRGQQLEAADLLSNSGLLALVPDHLLKAFLATAQIASIQAFATPPESVAELTEESHRSYLPEALHPWLARLDQLPATAHSKTIQSLLADLRKLSEV